MKHNIVKTENYLLVVDDSEIKEGNWYFDSTDKAALNPIYKRSQDLIEEYYGCKKIIAHLPLNNSPILEGVDLLPPLEDDFIELAKKYGISIGDKAGTSAFDFMRGYDKAKEKYKYTEEDLRIAIQQAFLLGVERLEDFEKVENMIMENIQQPKYPIGFECEMEYVDNHDYMDFEDGSTLPSSIQYITTPKTTTNSNGQTIWVGKYLF